MTSMFTDFQKEYEKTLEAAEATLKAVHAAQIEGDREKMNAAILKHEEAVAALWKIKDSVVSFLQFALRVAAELQPEATRQTLFSILTMR